jgi:hypothetical protein
MKRLIFLSVVVFVSLAAAIAVSGRSATAAQATQPKSTKPATPAAKLAVTSQQSAALKLAWDNLLRGYEDLLSTPPDVKGDTSKLEGHMKAAMEELRQIDPGAIPPTPANIPVEDKGHTRQFILDAVRGHLEKAKRVIEDAKVSSPNIQRALQNIAVAENDVTEIQRTPAKKQFH